MPNEQSEERAAIIGIQVDAIVRDYLPVSFAAISIQRAKASLFVYLYALKPFVSI